MTLSPGAVDIAPLGDRLVLFLPDIEHEARPPARAASLRDLLGSDVHGKKA